MKLADLLTPRRLELVASPALELTAELLGQRRWPLLKPVDGEYLRAVGRPPVNLSSDLLRTIAAVYDPSVEIAPLKFDHVAKGPAIGWVQRVGWDEDEGVLWIEPLVLDELREGIESKKWGRLSAEIIPRHPETKTPYLFAVAVLGAASPAIKLPFGRPKAEGDPPLIELEQASALAGAQPQEDSAMTIFGRKNSPENAETGTGQTPALEGSTEPVPQEPSGGPPPALPPSSGPLSPTDTPIQLAQTAQTVQHLHQRIVEQERHLQELRLSQTRLRVATRLDGLADRINLGARRYLEPVLAALMAEDSPQSLSFAQGESAVDLALGEAILLGLEQLQPAVELNQLGEEWAVYDDPSGPRSRDLRDGDQRQIDSQLGIEDDAALELQQKYPTADWSHN